MTVLLFTKDNKTKRIEAFDIDKLNEVAKKLRELKFDVELYER